MKNSFSTATRDLFMFHYPCCWCGASNWDALHHILGRVSSSPLNAAPIHNQLCHIGNSALDSFETKSRLLKQTLAILISLDYVLTPLDKEFMKHNEKYYTFEE